MDKMKVNIGCNKWNFGDDWQSIDKKCWSHIKSNDIWLHEYANNSIDLIYSSHMIAYFTKNEIGDLLTKWNSKIKHGGTLQIATPDFKAIAECYLQEHFPVDTLTGPIYGQMHIDTRPFNIHHETIYDLKKLSRLLHECGFDNIKQIKNGFYPEFKDQSWAYLPDRNYDDGYLISLNIECTKA